MKVLTREVRFYAETKFVKHHHVNFGTFPCVKGTGLNKDASMATLAMFDMLRPNKRSKKCGAKGSVALLTESTQLGCVSQDSYPRKSILRERGRLGSKHAVKFSNGTWHQFQNSGERVHREELSKSVLLVNVVFVHQEECARRVA